MAQVKFAAAAAAAFLCCGIAPSHAQNYGDAPWCAQIELGTGGMQWDCYYRSAEECAPNVVAGNRGTCNVNPYFTASNSRAAQAPHRKHRTRWR